MNCNLENWPIDPWSLANLGEQSDLTKFSFEGLNRKNTDGWTPFMYACAKGSRSTVDYLIKCGVSTSERDKMQRNCLMLAVSSGDLETVKSVCTKTNLEEIDDQGRTALFYSITYGRIACAEYFISLGANILARDNAGETVEDLANKLDFKLPIRNSETTSEKELFKEEVTLETSKILTISATPIQYPKLFKRKNVYSPNSFNLDYSVSPNKENFSSLLSPKHSQLSSPLFNKLKSSFRKRKLPYQCEELLSPKVRSPSTLTEQYLNVPKHFPPATIATKHSVPTVKLFLQQLHLEKYWEIFNNEEVDFDTLLTFEDVNLIEIGINLYGPRKKILAAIAEYKKINGEQLFLLNGNLWRIK